jgi:Zn-dependent peptidase ImmA (M78 family)
LKEWKGISGFIFLCEKLKKEPERAQTFTIAHEIAHRKLRHVSPTTITLEQYDAQEQAADDLALKWLPEYKNEWEQSSKLRQE